METLIVLLTASDAIESEAVLFSRPVLLTLPTVVGCRITGTVRSFCSSTDVVLAITKVRCWHIYHTCLLSTPIKYCSILLTIVVTFKKLPKLPSSYFSNHIGYLLLIVSTFAHKKV